MSTMSHLRVVTGWLVDLATITAGNAPLADAKAKIGATAGLLADDLPSAAFTRDSLRAMEFKFFPAYAELRSALNAWWDKNRPPSVLAVIATDGEGLSENDLIHLESWNRLRERHVASGRLSIALDLERKRSSLFRYICRTDAEAEQIARDRGWFDEDGATVLARIAADWGSITESEIASKLIALEGLHREGGLGALAAAGWLAFLRAAVEKHAPQHKHLVPLSLVEPRDRRSQTEQAKAIDPPRGRSRADDLALLAALRADPKASLERIAALREVLGA